MIVTIDTKTMDLLRPKISNNEERKTPFAFNVNDARTWLNQLPIINTALACKMLSQAFSDLNSMDIAGNLRYQLIEEIKEWPSQLLSSYETDILQAKFPLPQKMHELVSFSINFQQSLANAYISVILSDDFIDPINKKTGISSSKVQANIIYRTVECLNQVLLKSAQSYRIPPDDLWEKANLLFSLAHKNSLADQAIPNSGHIDSPTIASIFKCLHFFHLASPNRFDQREIRSIYALLEKTVKLISLSTNRTESGQVAGFFVDISSDRKISHIDKYTDESPSNLFFQTQPFIKYISGPDVICGSAEETIINFSENDIRLPAHIVHRLLQCWNHLPTRQFTRETIQQKVVLYPNLQNVLKKLFNTADNNNAKTKKNHLGTLNTSELELIPIDAMTPNYTQTIRSERVIEAFLKGEDSPNKVEIWGESTDSEPNGEPQHFESNTENHSAKGYQVNMGPELVSLIKTGDLIGVSTNEEPLEIAIVRRMSTLTDNRLALGLELIAPHAEIVKILNEGNKIRSRYLLMLPAIPAINQDISIISPAIIKLPNNIISLSIKNKKEEYRIQKLLESNSAFTHYTLEKI